MHTSPACLCVFDVVQIPVLVIESSSGETQALKQNLLIWLLVSDSENVAVSAPQTRNLEKHLRGKDTYGPFHAKPSTELVGDTTLTALVSELAYMKIPSRGKHRQQEAAVEILSLESWKQIDLLL